MQLFWMLLKVDFLGLQSLLKILYEKNIKRKDDCSGGGFFCKFKSKKINLDKHFFSDLVLQRFFFCLQMWKGVADNKKKKRLSKEEIKKQLLESMIIDENLEFDDLNKEAEKIQDPEKQQK